MAKKQTLLDELKASEPAAATGPLAWHELVRSKNPELMNQIDEVIDAFNAHDPAILNVRPSATSLANWIIPKLPIPIKRSETIRDYIAKRRHDAS